MSDIITLDVNHLESFIIRAVRNIDNTGSDYIDYEVTFKDMIDNKFLIGRFDLIEGNLRFNCNEDTMYSGVPHYALKVLAEYIENNLE